MGHVVVNGRHERRGGSRALLGTGGWFRRRAAKSTLDPLKKSPAELKKRL
jgi:hypothetical protein